MPDRIVHIKMRDCLVRFQQPLNGHSGKVTPHSFRELGSPHASQHDVTHTINDWHNSQRQNIPLWMRGGEWAMIYAGIDRGPFGAIRHPASHPGLSEDHVVCSIIIPSGVSKLHIVHADASELPGAHREVGDYLIGIDIKKGHHLGDHDFAYVTAKTLKTCIKNARALHGNLSHSVFTWPGPPGIIYHFELDHPWHA